MEEKNIMESILKDLKLESVIPRFAFENIEPENVAELSDEVLSRLRLTTIGDRHRLRTVIFTASSCKVVSLGTFSTSVQ